jgi:tetratricopeptide (TPR) repeat protein
MLRLGQMDRAWVRLKEATEADAEDVEARLLTAEMFISRGWPARARKILRALAAEARPELALPVQALMDVAAAPPVRVPVDAEDIEGGENTTAKLQLIERLLATGNQLRARRMLEGLEVDGAPPRVAELLWACRGEYLSIGESLSELARDLEGTADAGGSHGAERTSRQVVDEETGDPPSTSPGFPSLFRDVVSVAMPEDTQSEITQSSDMAGGHELADVERVERTDAHFGLGGEDTQIMEIIGHEADLDAEPTGESLRPMDLRSLLDEEDEEVVVMTRGAAITEELPIKRRGPIEVIEAYPKPVVRPSPPPEVVLPTAAAMPDTRPPPREPAPEGRPLRPSTLLIAVLIVALGLGYGAFRFLAASAANNLIDEVHLALSEGDYRRLQELEAGLAHQVRSGSMLLGVRGAELAVVEAALALDYTGDPQQVEAAADALEISRTEGGPKTEIAVAEGLLALARGDATAAWARAAIPGALGAEQAYVMGRAMVEGGMEGAQVGFLIQILADQEEGAIRHRLLLPQLLSLAGDDAGAAAERERLLASAGHRPEVRIMAHEQGWLPVTEEEHVAAMDEVLTRRSSLSPRWVGRAQAVRARAFEALGRNFSAAEAWTLARSADGTHPEYLYRAAGRDLRRAKVLDALDILDRCLRYRSEELSCRIGRAQVLVELDRLVELDQLVDALASDGVAVGHHRAWRRLLAGDAEGALGMAEGLVQEPGLTARAEGIAWMVLGLATGEVDGVAPRADRALLRATEILDSTGDPFDRLLADQAEAARLEYGNIDDLRTWVETLRGDRKPGAHVHHRLSRTYEKLGRLEEAEAHADKAARMAPESAPILFGQGLFYYDPRRSISHAQVIWRRYLELEPTGERAARTKERLGMR